VKLFKICTITALIFSGSVAAQTNDGSAILMPLEAQTCNLPISPSRIAKDAGLDELKTARANLTDFQAKLQAFRECLDASTANENITEGNKLAVIRAHDDSVNTEERIAEQFNVAVCTYKQNQGSELSDTCKKRLGLTD
jgi:hypothetical protein